MQPETSNKPMRQPIRRMRALYILSWVGVLTWIVAIILTIMAGALSPYLAEARGFENLGIFVARLLFAISAALLIVQAVFLYLTGRENRRLSTRSVRPVVLLLYGLFALGVVIALIVLANGSDRSIILMLLLPIVLYAAISGLALSSLTTALPANRT